MDVAEHRSPFAVWPARASRVEAAWLVLGVAVAIVAVLTLVPLGFLLWQSVRTPEWAGGVARTTLDNYLAA